MFKWALNFSERRIYCWLAGFLLILTLPGTPPLIVILLSGAFNDELSLDFVTWWYEFEMERCFSVVNDELIYLQNMSDGFLIESCEKRQLKRHHSHKVALEILQKMARNSTQIGLKDGCDVWANLFSQIHGLNNIFCRTAYGASRIKMNEFLTPLSQIIHNSCYPA